MSDVQMLAVLFGFFSPIVISVIQQPHWPKWVRAVITFLWSIVVGGLTSYFAGTFSGASIVSSILLVLVTAIATFKGFWEPTGISGGIEAATATRKPKTEPAGGQHAAN